MLTGYVDTVCRLWPYPRKICCPMLPHYVDRLCWHRMQLVATSKAGRMEDKGWCRDNKMRLEVARRPDFAAVPTINYYQDPTPYLYILYRSRKDSLQCHYHPDNVCVSAYFLLQEHDWKSEFKSEYYVDHLPGERRHLHYEVCTSVMNKLAIVVPPLDNMYEVPMNPMLDFRYIYLQKQLFSFPFWIIYRNFFMLYYILYSSFQSVFPYNIL